VGLKSLVAPAAMAFDRVSPPPDGITILIYHQVGGGTDSAVDLPLELFEQQLAHLAEHHRVLTLDEAAAELRSGQPTGWGGSAGDVVAGDAADRDGADAGGATDEAAGNGSAGDGDTRRGVVITFDDGTADFGDVVVPALQRHGLPATLYVATKFVNDGDAFPWGAPPTTWQALRDAEATGLVTLASHTHAHWLLDRLDHDAIDDDLDRSIDLLAEHTGAAPRHFAYPKAVPGSPAAEVAVRRRFDTAALAANRVNRPGRADLHRLWRTPVQRSDDLARFARKADGGFRLEGELRSITSRLRYRDAVR